MARTRPNHPHRRGGGDGVLTRLVRAAAHAAQRRPKTMIALWLALVAGCAFAGTATGTKTLTEAQSGTGQSAQADARVEQAHLQQPADENVLVRSGDPAATRAAAQALTVRLRALPEVAAVRGPADTAWLTADGGRAALVRATLRGAAQDAKDHVEPLLRATAAVARDHPGTTLQQAGRASVDKAIDEIVGHDLQRAEKLSVPLTLLILVLAFGALVAASVPLLLGLTSVGAALGALGVVSQLAPSDSSTASVVVLIGLAVGVDYSLFYIRREREERRAGRGATAALDVAAATVGRAILVSGITVVIALAGLVITGLGVFVSMGLATILVVLIAMAGSLTVLPAVLALLGDKVDRGAIPGRRSLRERPGRPWATLARAVTRRPAAAFVIAACVLAALAVPAFQMKTANLTVDDMPRDIAVGRAAKAIDRTFPGAPADALLVVTGHDLGAPQARAGLAALGARAGQATGGDGAAAIRVARDGRTAVVAVPMPDRGQDAARAVVRALRDRVAPTAARIQPGAKALVSGDAARSVDFSDRLETATPIVIAFVLGLAFVLLVATFRAPQLAAAVMGLNLLSIGAAYGMLVAVFQHTWAQRLLDFHSSGSLIPWIPLFTFVILFGLSMDYTVLVLERIREARREGRSARDAAAEGVAATAGAVSSAAVVMVAVFAIFATLRLAPMKQLGFGLAAAILLDATVIRGVALPSVVALLGERGWRVPVRRRTGAPPRAWDDEAAVAVAARES